jgi:hypothetical protein
MSGLIRLSDARIHLVAAAPTGRTRANMSGDRLRGLDRRIASGRMVDDRTLAAGDPRPVLVAIGFPRSPSVYLRVRPTWVDAVSAVLDNGLAFVISASIFNYVDNLQKEVPNALKMAFGATGVFCRLALLSNPLTAIAEDGGARSADWSPRRSR